MTRLSVVIPALNEQDSIREVAEAVLATRCRLSDAGIDELELIVVDDGSSDATAAVVSAIPDARLLRHDRNRGYGAALKTGFAAASGEWIGFLDGDGTYPPESFLDLCKVALARNADVVIGSRMAGAESQMPVMRRLGNVIFANLVSLISASRITDSASGMRVFKKSMLERIYPLPDGLNLTPVMTTRALHEQLRMVEVPIRYRERRGRSKLKVVQDGLRFAQSIVWTALSYNPVQSLALLSLAALGLAALIGLALVGVRLLGYTSFSVLGAGAVFLAMVLAVSGISLLTLGISFNYFVALFHKQPVRQGLFGRPILSGLDQHFGMAGLASLVAGAVIGLAAVVLGSTGRPVERLWIYYLASASFALVGIQLAVGWVQMQVLNALRARDQLIAGDLRGKQALSASVQGAAGQPASKGTTLASTSR